MSKLKQRGRKIISSKLKEPIFSADPEKFNSDLSYLLQWYNLNKTKKDSNKYFITYLKAKKYPKKIIADVMCCPEDKVPLNIGWLCRISENNPSFVFNEKIEKYFLKYLNDATKEGGKIRSKRKKTQKVTKNVQDYLAETINGLIEEIYIEIDNFVFHDSNKQFDIHSFFTIKKAKPLHVKKILPLLLSDHDELKSALAGTDDDLKDAYSHLPRKKLKSFISYYENLITECNRFLSSQVSVSKTRKKKVKTPEQIAKKVKYKIRCDEMKIDSLKPDKIIGACELWIYNTRYKKLSHYISSDPMGLSVKGSSIINFDEEKSLEKTLRKPLVTVGEINSSPRLKCKKVLDSLKTKESPCKGRMNENSIILKVFK